MELFFIKLKIQEKLEKVRNVANAGLKLNSDPCNVAILLIPGHWRQADAKHAFPASLEIFLGVFF